MSLAVVNGAMCQCSFGVAPCPLTVVSTTSVLFSNILAASIMDHTPASLSGFGMCSSMANPTVSAATAAALGVLTPQPCMPMISSPWTPGSPTVLFGQNPALTNTSKVVCAYGGIIQIINPGQQNVQIP